MKNFQYKYYTVLVYIILLVGGSCSSRQKEDINYDKKIYNPKYSSNFKIEGSDNSDNILISVFNPWQGSQDIVSRLLIVRDSIAPTNYNGQILKGNAQRIVCMSSTHIAMLDALDQVHTVVGVSGKEYVSNPKIIASSQFIPDIGYEGFINYESLISVNPDIVLLFSVNGASSMEAKLNELNIPYLYIGDYVEEDPLGKAEWIVPIAEVLGMREKGINKFKEISTKYCALKNQLKDKVSHHPKVMVNAPFLDSWFMPSSVSYVARLIQDAGGDYIYIKNTGNSSEPIDMEEALKLVSEADYWINIGAVKSMEELKSILPKFSNANCVVKGNLYNNNRLSTPGGGNDCYESGVMNPHLLLQDLVKILHTADTANNVTVNEDELIYYHRLK